jgi:PKD repeat protein
VTNASMSARVVVAKLRAAAIAVPVLVLVLMAAAERAGAQCGTGIIAMPVDFSVAEGTMFNGAVATFQDCDNPAATTADFNASIDWGDGSSTTAGTIVSSSAAFTVLGQHTYADEGSFTVTVTINDNPPGTRTATVTDTATVTEADSLSGSPVTFSAAAGTPFTGTVANFTDTLTTNVPGDFTATIDWGDATTTAGTVTGGGSSFAVSGTHTYAGTGTFTVTVTLSDDAPGTATAQVTSTAHVGTTALSVTTVNFSVAEHAVFNGTVATFTDSDKTKTPASFTATIDWGDATPTTTGVITGGSGSFTVTGTHTYTDEQSFTFTVTVAENSPGTSSGSATGTATVTEADVLSSGGAVTINATQGQPFTGAVANFSDTDTGNTAADFTATIFWGDATSSAGTVTGGGGSFTVSGTHTYASSGNFTVTVVFSEDAPGTATAQAQNTAVVAPPAPPAPPPIPALDFRGLLVLALALGGAGFYLLRLRRG